MGAPRIGIVVVAYNAATTLSWVLDRIPADVRPRISAILVSDDHSQDHTEEIGRGYEQRSDLPLTVVRQPRNLGYGGNQKFGYRWAIEQGLDIVVLLHGDGQYAPELLAAMVEPIVAGDAEVVLGSRMLRRGAARKGGMPAYKLIGNRILTRFQNAMTGMALSEWHSGYRAFSVAALAHIPFDANSDGFDFDTEVLLQLVAAGDRIVEVAIPTYYGDEICYVDGLRYARDVASDVVRYRMARIGFGTPQPGTEPPEYEWKPDQGIQPRPAARAARHPPAGARARPRVRVGSPRCRAARPRPPRRRCRRARHRRGQGAPRPLRRRRPRTGHPTRGARARAIRHRRRRRCAGARARPGSPAGRAPRPARRWRRRHGQRAEHRPLVPAPARRVRPLRLRRSRHPRPRPRPLLHPPQLRPVGAAQRLADHRDAPHRLALRRDRARRARRRRGHDCATPSAGSTGASSGCGHRCSPTSSCTRSNRADPYSVAMASRTFMFDAL